MPVIRIDGKSINEDNKKTLSRGLKEEISKCYSLSSEAIDVIIEEHRKNNIGENTIATIYGNDGISEEIKSEIIATASEIISRNYETDISNVTVLILGLSKDNIGVGGRQLSKLQ